MSEFIGSRISLISRSDIRYVGILHDIDSEKHTVALEQVVSHGTEGRRGDPAKEIAGSDNVYEYIVFRGGDVKDLRIEEAAHKPKPPQQVPDDPAILGSSVRPPPQYPAQGQQPGQYQPPIPQYYYPPPPQNQGRFGPSPYQAQMYGAYPPPSSQQQGMGQAPPAAPQQPPVPQQQPQQPPQASQQQQQQQPLQQQQPQQPQQPQQQAPQQQAARPPPIGPTAGRQQQFQQQQQSAPLGAVPVQPPQGPSAQKPQGQAQASQPSLVDPSPAYEASTQPTAVQAVPTSQSSNKTPTGPKNNGGIVPALPLPNARASRSPAPPQTQPNQGNTATLNQPSMPAQSDDTSAAVQDLANKVNQLAMRATPQNTSGSSHPTAGAGTYNNNSRQPGMGGFVANRGNRGNRGGFNNQQPRKVEVPSTDYDFEGANAKFNKQDLVKEVIASADDDKKPASNLVINGANGNAEDDEEVVIPPGGSGYYNRGSSFFDNISCENKERAEAKEGERPRGGAVWRGEEQKKNLETFGQGSVDGGFGHYTRGGWNRGRGGRGGRGFRGGRGYGYSRGNRGSSQQQGNPVAGAN